MERPDTSHPISITMDGTNYVIWAQAMSSFLRGRKFWRIVTGDITEPTPTEEEDKAQFADRLEDWDSKNHQIITWIRNSCATSISLQFGRFTTAKSLWDFLAQRYTTADLAHQYQLLSTLHGMKQQPGQTINNFLSEIHHIWDQLTSSEPDFTDDTNAKKFTTYRDRQRLVLFLMALTDNFEHVRASLLHRSPLPSLDQAVTELLSEETRLGPRKPSTTDSILATTKGPLSDTALATHRGYQSYQSKNQPSNYQSKNHSQSKSSKPWCNYCRTFGHTLLECRVRICKYCHTQGPGHLQFDCSHHPSKQHSMPRGGPSKSAATTADHSASTAFVEGISASHIEDIVKQILACSGNSSSTALSVTSGNSSWYFDSGCCNHMTPDPTLFSTKHSAFHTPTIQTADGTPMSVSHIGKVSTSHTSLPDTYCIPKLTLNLISVGQLCDFGLTVLFSPTGCCVQDPQTGQTLGIGRKVGRLFELLNLYIPSHLSSFTQTAAPVTSKPSLSLWHSRLGHASVGRLQTLVSSGQLGSINKEHFDCLPCQVSKQSALPFNKSDSFSSAPFDLIHSDVWGPSPTATMGGSRYFVIFIDDYSRYTWIFLMRSRSELPQLYFDFATMIKTQFSCDIKVFRADNAAEYNDSGVLNFLRQHGSLPHRSCPGTSQQNGRAERKHRDILNTVRTLLTSASCPERFWGEAALTAVYTKNRVPSPVIENQSPYERLYGKPPDYSTLKVFGCACFVLLQPHEHTKLESRSRLCCFLGYGMEHKGYRCWDPNSKRLRVSRHVVFWEHKMFSSMSKFHLSSDGTPLLFTNPSIDLFPDSTDTSLLPDTPHPSASPSPSSSSIDTLTESSTLLSPELPAPTAGSAPVPDPPLRQSNRVKTPSVLLRDYVAFSTILSHHEPQSYREASSNPLWQKAMDDELQALEQNHTWDLVDLPDGKNAMGCKWVYKIKTHSDGSIDRYKARLVAKGFTQEYGIDYEETFAPVARLTSVRSLIAVAAVRRWDLFQMDVKNAFLNGELTEEVYMRPPPGYQHHSHQVCKLRRALYGLKQAPRAWFAKFSTIVERFGFTASSYDSALFIRRTDQGIILLLLYVDDMIITGDDISGILDLKTYLSQHVEMKDLGKLNYFLGLEITSSSDGYYVSQAKYASDLLTRAGLTDSKTSTTPLEPNCRFTPMDGTLLDDPTLYRQLVGSLVYLTVTRPDISYAVHIVSQFLSAPRSHHYAAVLRILRYIKGTLFHGLHFSAHSSLELRAYSDADWAGDPTDRRSTTGYCFFLGDSLISWRSKKQTVVARSSTEAEYRALADVTQELLWLRWLLEDMGVNHSTATTIHCDNQSAIQIAHNDVFHERTKHIEIDCHFVRHHLSCGTIHLISVSSNDQTADVFTKAHPPGRLQDLVSKLKLVSILPP